MSSSSTPVSWWLAAAPGLVAFLSMFLIFRQRRWRDLRWLEKAATMPPEYVKRDPITVRDMRTGEIGWVQSSEIVASRKSKRVYVYWRASVQDEPKESSDLFAPLRLVRLRRGFSLDVRPGMKFRNSVLPWGMYGPVIEIIQVTPNQIRQKGLSAS